MTMAENTTAKSMNQNVCLKGIEKMKKVITILLAMALMLSVTACGGESQRSKMTKEEMLEVAEEWGFSLSEDILDTTANNPAMLDKYIGKIIRNTGSMIYDIGRDGFIQIAIARVHIGFTLPDEELSQIKNGDVIQIVGEIAAIDNVGSGAVVVLSNVYLIENTGSLYS